MLGWGYRKAGHYAEGKEAFLKAQKYGCDTVDLLNELAVCCMETGDLALAEKCLKDALFKDSENSRILINFGLLCLKKNDKEQAKGFFRTALEFDPDNKYAKKYLEEIE